MSIRPFRRDDAPALARLFHDAVHRIGRRHHSQAQVDAWSPAVPDPARLTEWGEDGRLFLVAVEADEPVAFGDLESDGHLDHLYCRTDRAGTGVTAVLYAAIEAAARERGLARLYVEASEPARRFFLRQGFAVEQRRDFDLNGVALHNYRMTKSL